MGRKTAQREPRSGQLSTAGVRTCAYAGRVRAVPAGLGRLARYDASYLGRVERGDQFATLAVAEACDRALGAGGELVRSWHAAEP